MAINYSKKDLKRIFKKRVSKRLNFMEGERQKLIIYSLLALLSFSFLAFFFITMRNSPQNYLDVIKHYTSLSPRFIVLTIVAAVIFILFYFYKIKVFRGKYKRQVVAPIIKTIIPDAKYMAKKGLKESDYIASEIITSSHNRYSSEDLVEFTYHGLNVQFSEVHSEYVTHGKNKTRRTIFRGFLLKCDLPYKLNHKTIVVPDVGESHFGKLVGRFFQKRNIFRKEKLVILEDIKFEKTYAVYAGDQIEARRILTPRIMERILSYNTKANSKVHLSFTPHHLYLAIPTRHNYFEPRIWRRVCFSDVIKMSRIISTVTEIIDVLEFEDKLEEELVQA